MYLLSLFLVNSHPRRLFTPLIHPWIDNPRSSESLNKEEEGESSLISIRTPLKEEV
jgi:hypothetical protein